MYLRLFLLNLSTMGSIYFSNRDSYLWKIFSHLSGEDGFLFVYRRYIPIYLLKMVLYLSKLNTYFSIEDWFIFVYRRHIRFYLSQKGCDS